MRAGQAQWQPGRGEAELSAKTCLPEGVGLHFILEAEVSFICSLIMLCDPPR